jgi:hypothetical protein
VKQPSTRVKDPKINYGKKKVIVFIRIKFLYFVDTTERRDRGRKEALSQGEDRVTLWITLIHQKVCISFNFV